MNLHNVAFDKFLTYKLLIKEGSFSKASSSSGRSYSSLINDIHSLERGLEARLYMPTKKIFIPTEEGLNILKIVENMFEQIEATHKKSYAKDEIVPIKMVATQSSQLFFLDKILATLSKYKTIDLKLSLGKFDEINEFEYDFDIFIGNINTRESLARKLLTTSLYGFYASKEYLSNKKKIIIESDIKNHDFLIFDGIHELSENLLNNNKIVFSSDSYVSLLKACAKGFGIASLPIELVNFFKEDDLVRICPEFISEQCEVYFFYKRITNKQKYILDIYKILKDSYR